MINISYCDIKLFLIIDDLFKNKFKKRLEIKMKIIY